jgi:hypothetical protein
MMSRLGGVAVCEEALARQVGGKVGKSMVKKNQTWRHEAWQC